MLRGAGTAARDALVCEVAERPGIWMTSAFGECQYSCSDGGVSGVSEAGSAGRAADVGCGGLRDGGLRRRDGLDWTARPAGLGPAANGLDGTVPTGWTGRRDTGWTETGAVSSFGRT